MSKLEFYRPCAPWIISQKFGENKACFDENNIIQSCNGNNPPQGWRSVYGANGHSGLDIAAPYGTPVYAAREGVVIYIDTNERSGLDVRIKTNINGVPYVHIYEHLSRLHVKVGNKVRTGTRIGDVGNTGYSTAPHLHFEIRKNFLEAIDPRMVLSRHFAEEILKVSNKVAFLAEAIAKLSENFASFLRKSVLK